jgi:acyl-CoA synthetase (AMP-forming)/AMP-acid ligase II
MYNEWISFRAKSRPDHVAVVVPSGPVRYGEFDGQIDKVAERLAALGIRAGGTVAVHLPDEYVHWLFVLALDRLGLASVSIGMPSPQHPLLMALRPDLVVTTAEGAQQTPLRSLAVTPQWYGETTAMPAVARSPRQRRPDEIVRYFASSGTTGTPKLMAVTRAQMEWRIEQALDAMGAGMTTRSCTLLGMVTAGGYTWPLAYWMGGGTVILNMTFTKSVAESLRRTQPDQVVLSVGTLLNLVSGEAAKLPPMPSMKIYCVGSVVPKALADTVRRVLTPDFNVSYAATEVSGFGIGPSALMQQHDGTAAYIFPGIDIEAVDDHDKPLPAGTTGALRVRGAGIISGYLNEELKGAARSSVRDGWFYSGDVGSVSADGLVLVAGRTNDVMNIGGNKYFPQAIEEAALACAGVRDAAVFLVPDKLGVEAPWIAVVRGEGHQPGELVGKLAARWPQLAGIRVVALAEIPRNQMGKIDRQTLRRQGQSAEAAKQQTVG